MGIKNHAVVGSMVIITILGLMTFIIHQHTSLRAQPWTTRKTKQTETSRQHSFYVNGVFAISLSPCLMCGSHSHDEIKETVCTPLCLAGS